ncbi:hypothetical protein VSS37_18215 [Candidatus Thiothrix sp. Deng01]|uniref:Chemotaxis methyl-accepting receptor HlyB-like 4HB MCP domain-containing protein n=1 Tax=Candidatus Thiothrix phosphatis TaxID=3112415 RepID=A0ABU6D1J9_9GAMM|nr:hypothetical protein [Candidatus Thiothrix sp. Deng01]MEB4592920.1 hypothetical protein [Candidatus Thiothrix sp. Deng01]
MRFWNVGLLVISILLLLGSAKALLDYWQYDEVAADVAQMMLHQVSADEIRQQVQDAISDDNPADARMYLRLAKTFGYAVDPAVYEPELQRLESPLNSARRTVNDFAAGFLDGQGESAASVAGAVTSDFTVVGDARDLWEQYQLYSKGEPVNELIVTLAGVGVGLTAASVMSAGAATPAKGGVSTTKLAARAGRLTPKFQKFLLREGKEVFDYKMFMQTARAEKNLDGIGAAALKAYNPQAARAIKQTVEQVNSIRRASSTADALHMLKYVDNGEELARLEKLSFKYGSETKGILKVLGKSAIGTVRILRKSTELLVSISATVLSFIAFLVSLGGIQSKNLLR